MNELTKEAIIEKTKIEKYELPRSKQILDFVEKRLRHNHAFSKHTTGVEDKFKYVKDEYEESYESYLVSEDPVYKKFKLFFGEADYENLNEEEIEIALGLLCKPEWDQRQAGEHWWPAYDCPDPIETLGLLNGLKISRIKTKK